MSQNEYFISNDGKYFCQNTVFGSVIIEEITLETKKIIDEFLKSEERFYDMFKKKLEKQKLSFEESIKKYEEMVISYL